MTTSQPDNEAIFHAARDIPDPDRRREYVRQACGGDETRIGLVEALLAAADAPDSLLDRPAGDLAATTDQPAKEGPGAVIGSYKLLEEIGEGGFGVVYMAEQTQPVRRKVALKILKPGMDTRQVIARFEAERQALALMDHPNIARVFDGGATASGRPYFVMELVKGAPITRFCDQSHLTPRERLQLFVHVCSAVQHAHQKGIIHRDLKPSNVLVTLQDGAPLVKVIDFGVAKALGHELTDKTMFTGFGQMIGTPLYMSPEQAGQSSLDVDTRSDVYSLGVLLYELLTGTTPFSKKRFEQAAYDEIRRIIREEEPSKPSTKLSTAEALPTLAANRGTEPAKLTKLVRGELDWIVMKALEKDRGRRYDTASGLAADVQRHLNDEPVQACPPSTWRAISRFARRHKAGLAAAGLLVSVIVLLGGIVGWVVRDAASRKERTVMEAKAARADVERLQKEGKWSVALALARSAKALLDSAGADPALSREFSELCRDLEMAAQLEEIRALPAEQSSRFDWVRLGPAYAQAFRDFGIDVEELAPAEAARQIRERTIAEELAAALDDWARARWKDDKAGAVRLLGVARAADPDPWRNRLREAIESGQRTILEEMTTSEAIDHLTPSAVVLLARFLGQGSSRGKAVEVMRRAQRWRPGDFWINLALAEVLSWTPATREEASGFCRAALACRPTSFAVYLFLGRVLQDQGKLDQAAEVVRRAIRLQPESAWGYLFLGDILACQDKGAEALAEYRRAARLRSNPGSLPPADPALFRQAERLVELDDKLPAVFRGEIQPRDAAERAEYAFVCHLRHLYAASARLYGEAFRVKPDLLEQHRYHAAWAAVLAGVGAGKDSGGLDEREKTRLRGQGLTWLRDEMDIWRQRLAKEPARSRGEILPLLDCWLQDRDLACLRDQAQMGRLQAAERGEWGKLWRDLRELRVSAQGKR